MVVMAPLACASDGLAGDDLLAVPEVDEERAVLDADQLVGRPHVGNEVARRIEDATAGQRAGVRVGELVTTTTGEVDPSQPLLGVDRVRAPRSARHVPAIVEAEHVAAG